jgi:hypothetical protein
MMDARQLQSRMDEALVNPDTGKPWLKYSPYLSSVGIHLQERLEAAAKEGGLEAMLDEYDRLNATEDPAHLRMALTTVLHHYLEAEELGVRLP